MRKRALCTRRHDLTGKQSTHQPDTISMATAIPGPLPDHDQHFWWRSPDGTGRLFAAEPGDARGDRQSSKLEEDR